MRRLVAAALVATLGLAAPGARADEPPSPPAATPPPSPTPREAAREHYRRGKALQAQAAYPDAIAEYQQALALLPAPEFLFNIAQCYRLSGDFPDAVDYYRRYLDAAPDGVGADEARGHIVTLTREIDAERREAAAKAPPVAPAEPAPAPVAPPITDVAPAPVGLSLWQKTAIAGGVLGLAEVGLATYYAVRAKQLSDEVSIKPESQWDDVLTAKYREGQRDARNSIIFFTLGGTAIASSVFLYIWFPKRADAKPRTRLVPTAGPGTAGLSFSTTF